MKRIIITALTAGLLVTGLTMPAEANGTVTATYGCNTATFSNDLSEAVDINYGTAGSDDIEGTVRVGAGEDRTVTSANPNFGWGARTVDGEDVTYEDWPGIDLPGRCSTSGGGGLAKTGV